MLDSKNVLYCSAFDINVNDWYVEYEHIEIFNARVRRNLGKRVTSHSYPSGKQWLEYFQGVL